MDIKLTSANYATVTTDGAESIDTLIYNQLKPIKHFVTSFQGSGTLEVSDNGTNWIDTGISQNEKIEPQDSLPRYARVSGTGEKIVHLIAL